MPHSQLPLPGSAPATTTATAERLGGEVVGIRLFNEDSGYCILRCKTPTASDPVVITGHLPCISEGQYIEAMGRWETHPQWGPQFVSQEMSAVAPVSIEGLKRFLMTIDGIGKTLAGRLTDAFGMRVLEVLRESPQQICDRIPKIGQKKLERMVRGYREIQGTEEIDAFLYGHGLGRQRSRDIYLKYGERAILALQENPYRVANEVPGFGFKLADQLALALGIPPDSPLRARAAVNFVLRGMCDKTGHCAIERQDFLRELTQQPTGTESVAHRLAFGLGIPQATAEEALEAALRDGDIIKERIEGVPCYYPARLHAAEVNVVSHLVRLLRGSTKWPAFDVEEILRRAGERTGIPYDASQRAAIALGLSSKVMIITGGPGTGKTTIVDVLRHAYAGVTRKIAQCAPTGKAAKRVREATGSDASTVHRLIGFDGRKYTYHPGKPLDIDVLIADETSMLDILLSSHLLGALPDHCVLLLVGDVDQLLSVGPGRVLGDLIDSGVIPTARLTEIHRQAAGSLIVVNAHRINRGEMPLLPEAGAKSDFYFVEIDERGGPEGALSVPEIAAKTQQMLLHLVTDRIPRVFGFAANEIQVLTPQRETLLGTGQLNEEMQKRLNPLRPGEQELRRGGQCFRPRDPVMQTRNDYELVEGGLFNGDQGWLKGLCPEEKLLHAEFDDLMVDYPYASVSNLTLAYANTIHKSQGSEYPCVVIPLCTQHYRMLQRNLLYTAITRGRRLVVLVGQKRALRTAVTNVNYVQRFTGLTERLQAAMRPVPRGTDPEQASLFWSEPGV